MTDIQLSQFMSIAGVRLTLKGLKGKEKIITLGTESYHSNSLTLLVDPYNMDSYFSLRVTKNGGLVLYHSPDGEFSIPITDSISLVAYSEVEDSDCFLQVNKQNKVLYVPISRRKTLCNN